MALLKCHSLSCQDSAVHIWPHSHLFFFFFLPEAKGPWEGGITASEAMNVLSVSKALASFTLERSALLPAEF